MTEQHVKKKVQETTINWSTEVRQEVSIGHSAQFVEIIHL